MDRATNLFEELATDVDFHFELLSNQVGLTVSQRMEDLGLTRSALARRLEKTPAWVTQLLRGDGNLTLRTLASLAVALEFEWRLGDIILDQATVPVDDSRHLALAA